ncbi:Cof-type HAD-IIB family hydrolase [Peribacillus sp. NPDC101481]|uniref:Cof-type HAD-IIB family hydrolase n=1 Tax=Bacillaceae TaxID=186817 RepID=UPI001E55CF2A|nr:MULTISPECIES: Cof-type HAD-IIB family hydrolase [Bacillaceae]MCT4476697.1 Cof-type HAD-IIB family hydrolase [Peribacillus frigoritolerans]
MKIVFFDIDGTLLDHEKKLPASTKKAIKQLQDSGVFVAIATGRAPFMFESLREELGIDTFVSFNGQYVVFEGKVVYKNPLSIPEIKRLHEHAEKNEIPIVFMNEETMKSSVPHHSRIEEALSSLKFPHPEHVADFYEDHDIYQALLFCSEDEEGNFVGNYDDFHFIRWHEYSTDVLPFGGSKAEGIKILMEKVGFALEDVYAFGDGLNDIEMLKVAGYGVAMGNAGQLVKQEADFVTKDVDDDGILFGLKELELI